MRRQGENVQMITRTECTEHERRWIIPVSAPATSRGTLEASLLEKAGTRGS